jgi:hypothetical protein
MSRRLVIDVVCRNPDCNSVLARELDDGTWKVRIAERDGHRWRTITDWNETFGCPDCKTTGAVDLMDMLNAGYKNRRRVRVPIRPLV